MARVDISCDERMARVVHLKDVFVVAVEALERPLDIRETRLSHAVAPGAVW